MSWIIDNSGTVYLLLGVIALVLAAAFKITRRVRFLAYLGGVLVLAGLLWLVARLGVTDRKQITNNLETMARAVVEREPDLLGKFLAEKFQYEGRTRADVLGRIKGTAEELQITGIVVGNFKFKVVSREQKQATVSFTYTVHAGGQPIFGDCEAVMVREADIWKLLSIEVWYGIGQGRKKVHVPI